MRSEYHVSDNRNMEAWWRHVAATGHNQGLAEIDLLLFDKGEDGCPSSRHREAERC